MDVSYFKNIDDLFDFVCDNDFVYVKHLDANTELYENDTHTLKIWAHERDSECFDINIEEKVQKELDFG